MGLIPPEVKREILAKADVVAVINNYVPLKKAGRLWTACCPFHKERTPSFKVDPSRQTWRCYGACATGGDVIGFLMEMEKLRYPEALRKLAEQYHVEIPETRERPEERDEREQVFAALAFACDFYQLRFLDPRAGKAARDYVEGRSISPESAARWKIGASTPGWTDLLGEALKSGIPAQSLLNAGLVRRSERSGRLYDFFRGRLMFPIENTHDRVIGFGARRLDDAQEREPKYINSPETPVFKKGREVYGLSHARRAILSSGEVAIMEGYTDVIMAHQHGVDIAVAPLGTALTAQQVGALHRLARRIFMVFDGDAAGQKSAEGKLPHFLSQSADPVMVTLPGGADPCDYLLENGAEAFRAALQGGAGWTDFLLARLGTRFRLDDPADQRLAVDEAVALLATSRDAVQRDLGIRVLAQGIGVSEEAFRRKLKNRASMEQRRREASRVREKEREEATETPEKNGGAKTPAKPAPEKKEPASRGVRGSLEADLLSVLLMHPEHTGFAAQRHPPARFEDRLLARVFECLIRAHHDQRSAATYEHFVATVSDERLLMLAGELRARFDYGEEMDVDKFVHDTLDHLGGEGARMRAEEVRRRQRQGEGDELEALKEFRRLQLLAKTRRSARGEPMNKQAPSGESAPPMVAQPSSPASDDRDDTTRKMRHGPGMVDPGGEKDQTIP